MSLRRLLGAGLIVFFAASTLAAQPPNEDPSNAGTDRLQFDGRRKGENGPAVSRVPYRFELDPPDSGKWKPGNLSIGKFYRADRPPFAVYADDAPNAWTLGRRLTDGRRGGAPQGVVRCLTLPRADVVPAEARIMCARPDGRRRKIRPAEAPDAPHASDTIIFRFFRQQSHQILS